MTSAKRIENDLEQGVKIKLLKYFPIRFSDANHLIRSRAVQGYENTMRQDWSICP